MAPRLTFANPDLTSSKDLRTSSERGKCRAHRSGPALFVFYPPGIVSEHARDTLEFLRRRGRWQVQKELKTLGVGSNFTMRYLVAQQIDAFHPKFRFLFIESELVTPRSFQQGLKILIMLFHC